MLALAVLAVACSSGGRSGLVSPSSTSSVTTVAPTSTKGSVPSTAAAPPTTTAATGAGSPPLGRALDLHAGRSTAFGIGVGDTSPEAVIKALTPVLGPPTRDTGVYATHLPDPEGCFGNQQYRIVRWGNLAYMFRHPDSYVLAGWTLGSTRDLWEPKYEWPEPRPVIEQPAVAATTADGLGIGSPLRTVRKRYAMQPSGPHLAAVGPNPVVSPVTVVSYANGVITGIGSNAPACA